MTDTLERRKALIAQLRTEFVADGDATRRKTDAEMCAERREAATLLALTPSPRVDEGRSREVLEEAHGAMARAIDSMASGEPWRIKDARNLLERNYDRLRILLSQIEGEG
jgi:hypothetical protein